MTTEQKHTPTPRWLTGSPPQTEGDQNTMTAAKIVRTQAHSSLNCLTGKSSTNIWQTSFDHYSVDLWLIYSDGLQIPLASTEHNTPEQATREAHRIAQREHAYLVD